MPQFKLRPEGFALVKKRIVIRFVVICIICFPLVIFIGGQQNKVDADTNAVISIFMFLFLALIFFFSIRRSLKQVKELYLSYMLIIEGNTIKRLRQNTPTISFYFNEITSISKTAKGDLTIKGAKPGDTIYVPPTIENQDEIEQLLSTIQPIAEKAAVPFIQKYNLFISATVLIMMVCIYTVSNKIIVAVSGAVVSLALLWGLYDIQTNKNVDSQTKRNMFWVLIVLLSVVTVTIIKLRM